MKFPRPAPSEVAHAAVEFLPCLAPVQQIPYLPRQALIPFTLILLQSSSTGPSIHPACPLLCHSSATTERCLPCSVSPHGAGLMDGGAELSCSNQCKGLGETRGGDCHLHTV